MSNDLTAKIISSYGNRDQHSTGPGGLDVNSAATGWDSSRPGSIYTSSRQSAATLPRAAKRKFKSYRLRGEYDKPWLADPAMKKTRWNDWIVIAWCLVGLAGAGVICFMGIRQYQTGPFCLVFEDDFKTLDTSVWTHMVTVCSSSLLFTSPQHHPNLIAIARWIWNRVLRLDHYRSQELVHRRGRTSYCPDSYE